MVEQDIDTAKIMLAGRCSSLKMVTRYAQRINAKKGDMVELNYFKKQSLVDNLKR